MSFAEPRGNAVERNDFLDIDLAGMVRRKFWLLLFFVIGGVGLGVLGYLKLPRTYLSEAKVRVDTKLAPSMADNKSDTMDAEHPVDRYIEEVKSVAVLEAAIEAGKFEDLKTFADTESIIRYMRKNFVAKPADTKRQSGAMILQFYGPAQDETRFVLDQIVIAYETYIKAHTVDIGSEVIKTVNSMKGELDQRILEINSEISKLNNNPSFLYQSGVAVNPHQLQQIRLQEELDILRSEQTKMTARLQLLETAVASGQAPEQMAFDAIQDLNSTTMGAYVQTHQKLLDLKVQEQSMMGEFGTAHPELINLRNSIRAVEQMKMQELSILRGGTAEGQATSEDFVRMVIEGLKTHIGVIEAQEEAIRADMQKEQAASLVINADVMRLNDLQRERERAESTYNALLDQLNQYNVLKEFDWKQMEVQNRPSRGEQSAPSLLLCVAAGLFLGSMAGLGFSLLQELAAKTFRSSEQISQQLGTKVVAHVPEFNTRIPRESTFKHLSGDLIAIHRPNSIPAEAYRSLRTSIFFRNQKDNSSVILFTSPTPADGKSTTAANVATVIAQSGRKVLLIDCDFRRPTQHVRFGLKNDVGLTSLITGTAVLSEIFQECGVDNLTIVASGPHFSNPSELLTSGHLESFLKDVREEYDFVIVDSPPVLPVTDPCIISSFVDVVYLPLRLKKGVQVSARRAIEALQTVGVTVEGVIVNGLQKKDGASYRYGDKYSYGNYGAAYGNSTVGSTSRGAPNRNQRISDSASKPTADVS